MLLKGEDAEKEDKAPILLPGHGMAGKLLGLRRGATKVRAGCPGTDGSGSPTTSFTPAWGLPALQGSGPVSPSPCPLVAKRPWGICTPSVLGEEKRGQHTPVPPHRELEYCCRTRLGAPWVL